MKRLTALLVFLTLVPYGQAADSITSSDGTKIAYTRSGSGGITLIFVHGWCCSKEFWDRQVGHFSRDFTVIAMDMGGYGESGRRKDHSFPKWGDDIVSLVDSLELKNVILVGHSVGGFMTLNAAAKLGDRALALVGADAFRGKLGRSYTQQQAREAADGIDESTFKDDMRDNERWFVPRSDPEIRKWITEKMVDCPIDTAAGGLKAYYEYMGQTPEDFLKVKCPIFGINSDRSKFDTEFFESRGIPFRPYSMADVGHFIMMDDPAAFNALLEECIAAVR